MQIKMILKRFKPGSMKRSGSVGDGRVARSRLTAGGVTVSLSD